MTGDRKSSRSQLRFTWVANAVSTVLLCQRPLQPLGKTTSHDPFKLRRGERIHFLGKQRDHLLVRAWEMGEIRAPKAALRSKNIDHPAHQRMKCREWIRLC